jgi:hypothetical protein
MYCTDNLTFTWRQLHILSAGGLGPAALPKEVNLIDAWRLTPSAWRA